MKNCLLQENQNELLIHSLSKKCLLFQLLIFLCVSFLFTHEPSHYNTCFLTCFLSTHAHTNTNTYAQLDNKMCICIFIQNVNSDSENVNRNCQHTHIPLWDFLAKSHFSQRTSQNKKVCIPGCMLSSPLTTDQDFNNQNVENMTSQWQTREEHQSVCTSLKRCSCG